MDFQDLFKARSVPETISLNSSPVDVLTYIKAKGLLALDIDFIDDYILHHTPVHTDEWVVDEDCVGEIKDYRDLAAQAIEDDELRWEEAINNPSHPDHQKEWAKLNDIE